MTDFISSRAIVDAPRVSLQKLQIKLAAGQKETTTGRLADVGRSLGYETGRTVSLRQQFERLTQITDTNALVASRLDASQAGLKQIAGNAESFLNALIGSRESVSAKNNLPALAKAGLNALIDTLNTEVGGEYIFAGINSGAKPVAEYYGVPTSAGKMAVDAAFLAEFGFAQTSPAVETIDPFLMEPFLTGAYDALFSPANWTANWSDAAGQNVQSRISSYEQIETSANANEEAFRTLAKAYGMIADLGLENMNAESYAATVNTAIKLVAQAAGDIGNIQSRLGTAQERVKNANERMDIQLTILSEGVNALETVDPYEASTKVSALITQIETAYALTARIQRLSLLNYL